MDVTNKGTVNYHEFLNYLGLDDSPEMLNLFTLMDEDDTGEIDFREYLVGFCMVNHSTDPAAVFKLAFSMVISYTVLWRMGGAWILLLVLYVI